MSLPPPRSEPSDLSDPGMPRLTRMGIFTGTRCKNRSIGCVYDLAPRVKVPLNPAYMGTTTTFSSSMDVFSAQSQHQPNMSNNNNNNYPFFDEQPHQIAAKTTPELDFSFMPPTTPAAAHIMMDGSPLSGDFTTGTNNSPSNHNRGRFYVKWKKRRSLSPGGGTQASHSLQWSTPTASFLASSNLVDPALKDDTAVDWAANSIADAFFGPHSMPLLPGLDKSFSHQDIQSFSHQDVPLQDIRSMPLSFQDIQSMFLQGVQPMPNQDVQPPNQDGHRRSISYEEALQPMPHQDMQPPNQDGHRRSISYEEALQSMSPQDMQPPNQDGHRQPISYQVLQSMSHQVQSMSHQDIEPLPKREMDSLPNQDERRPSISYEALQSMSPQATQAMSHQEMQTISYQDIQSMPHQDIEPLPKREIDSLPSQDERRRSISYEALQSMSPQAIQAMSNQDMQSISLQAIQSMSHQDTAIAY
ncbi:hypothetical protein E4U13_002005 [Claviceps humidiphila]|uniref:Uncharacterized protein n=1 Tax=Claviceps humidiphila TaxID=1294629 RepID=A0A9P7Q1L1_9HYPO|nr:hypothetical protein E4U13_002005 [Claviceps humidiphila]